MEIWTPGFLWNPLIHVYDIHGLHGHVHRTDSRLTTYETREAITNQAKPYLFSFSSSPRKPWAKSGKNKIKSQVTPTNWTN